MARHNTQTFVHFLNLHFIQVQIINLSFSYIRLQMICLVILSSIIFRKEKVIIIAGVSFTDKQEDRNSLSQEQSMIRMRKNKACTSMPKHISRKKGTMREDNEIFSFSFGRVRVCSFRRIQKRIFDPRFARFRGRKEREIRN